MTRFKLRLALMPILSGIAIVLALSACHPGKRSRSERPPGGSANARAVQVSQSASPPPAPTIEMPREFIPYSPEQVTQIPLQCATPPCPAQVGLILYFLNERDQKEGRISTRCTGTLAGAADSVLAAGHCDQTSEGEGYFVTQFGQAYRITGVLSKVFTPKLDKNGQRSRRATGKPDVALFRLERPVENMRPLTIASGPQAHFDQLSAYVVNAHPVASKGFIIESVTCPVRRHEYFWPYSLSETPDIIMGFDCQTQPGNSGASMFAPGSDAIQAVYFGYGDSETGREDGVPLPAQFQSKWRALATNIRCVTLGQVPPNPHCLRVSPEETARRTTLVLERALGASSLNGLRSWSSFATQFEPKVYPLATGSRTLEPTFEVVYYPSCRRSTGDLSEVQFPQLKVKMTYGEWGTPKFEVLEEASTFAQVERRQKDLFQLKAYWQPAFGSYEVDKQGRSYEEQHPRNIHGDRFTIELPLCSK